MARLTTSRAASSSTNRSPRPSRQQGPVAAQGLRQQGPGHGGMVQGGRVELEELDIGHGHPGPQGHGDPVAGRLGGVGRDRVQLTRPPVASTTSVARTSCRAPSGSSARTPTQRPSSTKRSTANHCSSTAAALWRTAETRARSTSAPVAAPPACTTRAWSAPLAGQGEVAARLAVNGPEGDQLVDAAGTLVDEDPHGVDVAQTGAGRQGVGQVQVGGVLVPPHRRGHAPLGPPGRRLGQVGLGQDPHPQTARRRQAHDGRQPRHAGTEDEDVELHGVAHPSARRARPQPVTAGRSAGARPATVSGTAALVASTWTTTGSNPTSSAVS